MKEKEQTNKIKTKPNFFLCVFCLLVLFFFFYQGSHARELYAPRFQTINKARVFSSVYSDCLSGVRLRPTP
ncbi:hypothetical protein AALP_AA7G160800 [Arabis alpina]|uniref:Uncharacterized protein n=1 Tax=Arabis alpina TaxID=50452 RepID=A0A087GIE7_ARAAL|nr:hypothetical protein AALP_AA7G160800 [Arabis alpina]